MTLPAGFPYPLNQTVEIPLEQIIPNPDQPRQIIYKETIEELAASVKAEGQKTAAKVRPLTEAERVAHPGAWIMLVGGHRRRLAALLNGSKTLKCIVEDIAPQDTFLVALLDNAYEDMSPWEWDLAIERVSKTFTGTLEELAARLNKGTTKVKVALRIAKAFNPAARALVNENLQKTLKNEGRTPSSKNKGFSITEENLLVLAGLEDPELVLQALRVVLDEYLPPAKTQELVAHIQAGNHADSFDPKAAKTTPQPKEPKTTTQTAPVDVVPVPSIPPVPPSHSSHTPKAPTASAGSMSEPETVLWEAATGISVISQIKAKIKKGERPSLGEALLLAAYQIWHGLVWVTKHGFKWTKVALKLTWKLLHESLEILGIYKFVRAVVFIALLIGLLICGWYIHQHGVWSAVRVVEQKIWPAAEFTPAPTVDSHLESTQSNLATRPDGSQQMPQPTIQAVSAVPTIATSVPTPEITKEAVVAKAKPTLEPTAVTTVVAQAPTVKPTAKPQGDLFTQGADAATKGAGIAKALGL